MTMLRELVRIGGKVSEPRIEQHVVPIRRRPVRECHPCFKRRYERTHADRKQSDDTGGRRQLTDNGMDCRIGNRHGKLSGGQTTSGRGLEKA